MKKILIIILIAAVALFFFDEELFGLIAEIGWALFSELPVVSTGLALVNVVFELFVETEAVEHPGFKQWQEPFKADETWAIYWYLCGTDLESNYGMATNDINEMLAVKLPDNVKIVIETGGANTWVHEAVDARYNQLFLYDSQGFRQVNQKPAANMGSKDNFIDFLGYCVRNYPADHQAVVLWDHGGGSISGIVFDERNDFDSMSIRDVRDAFDAVCWPDQENPPFEFIGFDACLMSTLETASALQGFGRYMVASEELEPGVGWNYTGFMQAFVDNPTINGVQLGKAICDSYAAACKEQMCAGDITLSVVDLTRLDPLFAAYSNLGKEALQYTCENPSFVAEMGRKAKAAENYSNSALSYSNMVDLGDLVRQASDILPVYADAVLYTLNECVPYRVFGPYRSQSSGLSCFYSFDKEYASFEVFQDITPAEPFIYYYGYVVTGGFSQYGTNYIASMGFDDIPVLPSFSTTSLEDFPLYVDDDGYFVLDIDPDIAEMLSAVYYQLCLIDEQQGQIVVLGRDNDIHADWQNGMFRDNFRGVWGALDGQPVYMDITYESDDYNLYNVPILLNGEAYNLVVCYDFAMERFNIFGARKELDSNGMSSKDLVMLRPGDKVTILRDVMPITGGELQRMQAATVTLSKESSFEEIPLPDGMYGILFEMIDAINESKYSDIAFFDLEGGEIYIDE